MNKDDLCKTWDLTVADVDVMLYLISISFYTIAHCSKLFLEVTPTMQHSQQLELVGGMQRHTLIGLIKQLIQKIQTQAYTTSGAKD